MSLNIRDGVHYFFSINIVLNIDIVISKINLLVIFFTLVIQSFINSCSRVIL